MQKIFWLWPVFTLVSGINTGDFFFFWFSVVAVIIIAIGRTFQSAKDTPVQGPMVKTEPSTPTPSQQQPVSLTKTGMGLPSTSDLSVNGNTGFCGSCGGKFLTDDQFCGNCGLRRQ